MILPHHKKLVVAGCSFTEGFGLDNPEKDSWPELLANYFNLDCINLAKSGSGNSYIADTVLEYSLTNNSKNCFFVIAFSDYLRMDFSYWGDKNIVVHLSPSTKRWPKLRDLIYPEYANQEYFLKKFLLNVIKMQATLKLHNIDYIMVNSITDLNKKLLFQPDMEKLTHYIDRSRYKHFEDINFNVIIQEDGKFPDGHPNLIGHKRIAETMKKWILESTI